MWSSQCSRQPGNSQRTKVGVKEPLLMQWTQAAWWTLHPSLILSFITHMFVSAVIPFVSSR